MCDLYNFKEAIKALHPEFICVKGDHLSSYDHEIIKDVFNVLTGLPVVYKNNFIREFLDTGTVSDDEYFEIRIAFKTLKAYSFKKKLVSGFLKYLVIYSKQHLRGYAIEIASLHKAVEKYLSVQGVSEQDQELIKSGKRKEFIDQIQEKNLMCLK